MILEAVQLLVGLRAAFAEEDFEEFERGRVDRAKAVGAEHAAGDVHDSLARNHGFRQKIAEAFKRAGLDGGRCH
jgi:hypothetical protein